MGKVSKLLGMNVTPENWKSEYDMIRKVSEEETMYYGGNIKYMYHNKVIL
jgi:hypothetical protein